MVGRRPLALLAAAAWAALVFPACSSSGRGASAPTAAAQPGGRSGAADAALAERGGGSGPLEAQPQGDPTVVTWEALAVERDAAENSKFRRPGQASPNQKIVLINESHSEAKRTKRGRTAYSKEGVSVAVLSDADMDLLVRGFEQAGFFRLARDTTSLEPIFEKPDARGRITVERGGRSVSIVSMRGQGLAAASRDVPQTYSQLKQAIALLRNQTPTLSVTTVEARGRASPR
jgi:hypothetical protein